MSENKVSRKEPGSIPDKKQNETSDEQPWRLQEWFPHLSQEQHQRLRAFHELLIKFNKTLNLVSDKSLGQADSIHFADSILSVEAIRKAVPKMKELYDFGIGNGFPGFVVSILYPDIQVIGVDIDVRKGEFLKHSAQTLGISNFKMVTKHVENLDEGSVEYAVSRGFAPLSKALVIARRSFKPGGVYFHMKSEEWSNEVASIPSQVCAFWQPALVKEYRLPVGEIRYALVRTDRMSD